VVLIDADRASQLYHPTRPFSTSSATVPGHAGETRSSRMQSCRRTEPRSGTEDSDGDIWPQ